jgi:hypothetical protein
MFPIYSHQLPSSAPPPKDPLPPPFQNLCLGCIVGIHRHFIKPWHPDCTIAAALLNRFVNQSMSDTVSACYDDYYTASEKEICENDCYTAYDQAWGWVKQRVKEGKEWKDQMAGGPSGSQSNGTD